MRKVFIVFFTWFAFVFTKAQVFFVGDTNCNYIRLDTNIRTYNPGNFGSWFSGNSYSIDCDQDLVNDIVFTKSSQGFNGGSGTWSETKLNCTSTTGVQFVYKTTSASCTSGSGNVLDSLTSGTSLNSALNWSTTLFNSCIYDTHYSNMSGSTTGCGYFKSINNPLMPYKWRVYIGFRKILSGDTIYGWILLHYNYPNNKELVSMAYKHTLSNNTVTPVFTSTTNSVCLGGTVALSASPPGGAFYGAGVSGNVFYSTVAGPGIQNVYYTNGCSTAAAVKNITVNPPPIDFSSTPTVVCSGYSLSLNASPSGGTFAGPGVSANVFYSSSVGTSTVSYSYTDGNGCSNTKTLTIKSFTAPVLNVISSSSLSCPSESVTLSINGASNYTWSTGAQASSIIINPTTTSVYSVTGEFSGGGCPASSATFTQSVGNPTITLVGHPYYYCVCPGDPINVFAYGASNYTWSTGSTGNNLFTNPTINTTYSIIGTNSGGCFGSASFNVTMCITPTVNITSSQSVSCAGDTVKLYFTGASNVQIYDSLTTNYIDGGNFLSCYVKPFKPVTYKIKVSYGTGCYYYKYFHQNVNEQNKIINAVLSKNYICNTIGDTVTLRLSGSKSYSVTIGSTTYTTNTSTLVIGPLSYSVYPNSYVVYGINGDSVVGGCRAAGEFTLNITGCVGIQELNKENNLFTIYPNPNNGEFEIKGIKEETIFISNELGQLISTKYLTKENNFTVKLNELQNGIYFVGNKFSRQKVVVIK